MGTEMNSWNFLQWVKQIVPGSNANGAADGGFLVDVDITKAMYSTTATYASTTLSTGTVTVAQSIPTIGSTTGTAASYGPFKITRDYDQTSDNLQFRLLGSTVSTSTITLVSWLSNVAVPGASTLSTYNTQSTQYAFTGSTFIAFTLNQSGNSMAQDDVYTFNVSTTGGLIVTVVGGAIVYSSDLVAWDQYGSEMIGTASTQLIRTA